jgi:hypothetical protein
MSNLLPVVTQEEFASQHFSETSHLTMVDSILPTPIVFNPPPLIQAPVPPPKLPIKVFQQKTMDWFVAKKTPPPTNKPPKTKKPPKSSKWSLKEAKLAAKMAAKLAAKIEKNAMSKEDKVNKGLAISLHIDYVRSITNSFN